VRDLAADDRRVRLVQGAPLPAGWNGKQHACHQLATAARHPVLLFVDADVRLAPDAAARLQGEMKARDLALVSGFPRQVTGSLGEALVIPQIMVILLGYLPFAFARRQATDPRFAAGCGQLMMVTAEAYARAGGHAAFRRLMHDGLNLPRNVRRSGGRTDIVDATPLAACRMYEAWPRPLGRLHQERDRGHGDAPRAAGLDGAPRRRACAALGAAARVAAGGSGLAATLSAAAIAAVLLPRALLALRLRQPATSVLLHPVGVAITLAIQYAAFTRARRGGRAVWRGRSYDFQ
jgi:hypothetical protein